MSEDTGVMPARAPAGNDCGAISTVTVPSRTDGSTRLTLPVTLLTVGLFLFVINGLMLWAASGLLGGLHVAGFWAAVWGAILYSLLGMAIDSLLARLFPQ